MAREAATQAVKDQVTAVYEEKYADHEEFDRIMRDVAEILEQMEHAEVRRLITEDKVRPDGRKVDEIGPLDAVVDFLPRVHGSGLFTRGQTQALSVLTLAPMGETQIIDGLDPEYKKRFMHHYNFPQYSVGETGRYGAPGRREIGHGALGERALAQVLPSLEDFPYAIRLVAEVLESNGSSSQASICAGTLALMAGGVPIKAPVAGIAMGLISDGNNYTVLTDIKVWKITLETWTSRLQELVTGLRPYKWISKFKGLLQKSWQRPLAQAKKARFEILDVLEATIPEVRPELAPTAPKIDTIKIDVDKIKIVIGKGGETIDKIIAETGVKIDIDEEGNVSIYSSDQDAINRAKEIIAGLVREAKVDEVYRAKVVRIEKFGAFVNLFDKTDALVHISEMAWTRTNNVEDLVAIGDEVDVKVIKIDEKDVWMLLWKLFFPRPPKPERDEKAKSLRDPTPPRHPRTTNLRKNLQKHQKIQNKKRRNVWDGGAETIDIVKENDPAARTTLEVLLTYPGVKALAAHRISAFSLEAWLQTPGSYAQSVLALLDSDWDSSRVPRLIQVSLSTMVQAWWLERQLSLRREFSSIMGWLLGNRERLWQTPSDRSKGSTHISPCPSYRTSRNRWKCQGRLLQQLVVADVPSDVTVVGIPAKIVRYMVKGWAGHSRSRRKTSTYVNKLEQAKEASHRIVWVVEDSYMIQARNKLSQEELSEAKK